MPKPHAFKRPALAQEKSVGAWRFILTGSRRKRASTSPWSTVVAKLSRLQWSRPPRYGQRLYFPATEKLPSFDNSMTYGTPRFLTIAPL
jgi:hypothetical protein